MKPFETLIKNASDHDGCSTGEYHTAQFLRSLVTYVVRCNMKELLFYVDLDIVKEILEIANRGDLEEIVQELNPKLLEIVS